MSINVVISYAYSGIEKKREINPYKEWNGCNAIISHKPIQPACQHRQSHGEPLEPLPRLEAAQPYGSGGSDPAGVGNLDR